MQTYMNLTRESYTTKMNDMINDQTNKKGYFAVEKASNSSQKQKAHF